MGGLPDIQKVTTSSGYTIGDLGVFPRVSNILSMANFGGNALKRWEYGLFEKYLLKQAATSYTRDELLKIAFTAYEEPKRVVKGACDFGTDSHKYIEAKLTDGSVIKIPDQDYADAQIMMQSIDKFFADYGITKEDTWACEQFVYSEKYKVAGTIDYILKKGGALHLLDWKTSSHISPKYPLQLSIYIKMLEERLKANNIVETIAGATIVKFEKKSVGYELFCFSREEAEKYFRLFLHCLDLYNYEHSDHRNFALNLP